MGSLFIIGFKIDLMCGVRFEEKLGFEEKLKVQ